MRMKYIGMPMGMWTLFGRSFERNLLTGFGLDRDSAKAVAAKAKPRYKEIIAGLPEFEKGDRFKMNIAGCALLAAFVLNMPKRPDVRRLTAYYSDSMMTPAMKWFCRKSGKSKFTKKDISSMKATERLRAADRNPYSWNMVFYPYPDGSGYEARFTACGICTLMRELELYDLVPAMCRLDHTMAEAGGTSDFVREYTLASGGPYCDCGYKKKRKGNGRKRK
ncbi:L-2-amino-thiazoline-4-carboxylic acid hydrolase [Petralouisia muris]